MVVIIAKVAWFFAVLPLPKEEAWHNAISLNTLMVNSAISRDNGWERPQGSLHA